MRRALINRARRLAENTVAGTFTDTVRIYRNDGQVYRGPARFVFTGRTEVVNSEVGQFVFGYAEMHIPARSAVFNVGDNGNIETSLEPSLVGKLVRVEFSEPATSISGFQRLTIRLDQ